MLGPRLQLLLDGLRRLLRRGGYSHARRLLAKARPPDVAAILRFIDEGHRARVFELLPDDGSRAELLTELEPDLATELLVDRPIDEVARLIGHMSADDQADVLEALPVERRQQLIEALRPDEAEELEELLHYEPDTAGGIMSPDFFALPEQTTVEEAIRALRSAEDVEMAFYVYAINDAGQLVGVVSLRQLVVNPPETPLRDLMATDVIAVTVDTDQEEVARLAARYNLLAIPVVDDTHRLVGIVTIDDVIDVIREEATEDILLMAGADETVLERRTLLQNFRIRAPWLFATWIGGLAASVLIGAFEEQLEAQVALAAFIPIVLGMGGNVGTQTATIIVRGLATGRLHAEQGWRYLSREGGVGMLLGAVYGLLLAVFALVWYAGEAAGTLSLAMTVGVSILASMSVAATIGATVPLALERLGIDPAVATGPLVTTTVDVVGILAYFLVARTFIDGLS